VFERQRVEPAAATVRVVAGAAQTEVDDVDHRRVLGHPVEPAEEGGVGHRRVGGHHLHGPQPGAGRHADDTPAVVTGGGQTGHERAVADGVLPRAGTGAVDTADDVEVRVPVGDAAVDDGDVGVDPDVVPVDGGRRAGQRPHPPDGVVDDRGLPDEPLELRGAVAAVGDEGRHGGVRRQAGPGGGVEIGGKAAEGRLVSLHRWVVRAQSGEDLVDGDSRPEHDDGAGQGGRHPCRRARQHGQEPRQEGAQHEPAGSSSPNHETNFAPRPSNSSLFVTACRE
jgi:hypothetical protein